MKSLLVFSLLMVSLNSFASEKMSCRATIASTAAQVTLKFANDGIYSATLAGYDFEVLTDKTSINMAITKPAKASGDREVVSSGQVRPTIKNGNVNMYISNSQEQVTLICRAMK